MADKDIVKVGDIVRVKVKKPVTGKFAKELESQGYKKPNRLGQTATVSGISQTNKAGDTIWTTANDGKVLIKYIEFQHPDGYTLPNQPPGKPPVLDDGDWELVSSDENTKTESDEKGERAREEDGTYKPDDPSTPNENEAWENGDQKTSNDEADDSDNKNEPQEEQTPQGDDGDSSKSSKAKGATSTEIASGVQPFETSTGSVQFNVQSAGWTPLVNTREVDVKKLEDALGSKTLIVNDSKSAFKVRLLFSGQTNGLGRAEISTQSDYDKAFKDPSNMIVREFEIGQKLKKSDIVGTGTKATPIGANHSTTDASGSLVNEMLPATCQVTTLKITFADDGSVEEVGIDLLNQAGGASDTYYPTYKVQTSSFSSSESSSGGGFGGGGFGGGGFGGGGFGSGGTSSSSGDLKITPSNNIDNKFYDPVNINNPAERAVIGIVVDIDNALLRDYWKPLTVDWDKAPSIKTNVVDGKNIGGVVKIQMECESGNTTDLIPGRWVDYTADSPKSSWSKYPRSVALIMPLADDTQMKIMSDTNEKMGAINEIKYHKIGNVVGLVQLVSEFERTVLDEKGNAILEDPSDPFSLPKKENVRLVRTLEKGNEVSFDVATRKGVGTSGTQELKGIITLITVDEKSENNSVWDARKGQRFSFLSLGQQTITYLRHKSANDNVDRYYIIVSNKPNEPNTGQVIVIDKSQPDVDDAESFEQTDVVTPSEGGE